MSKALLSQNQRIKRLYRHSLKNCLSWCIDREIWYDESNQETHAWWMRIRNPDFGFFEQIERIRGLFEKNAAVRDRATIDRLLVRGEQELRSKLHPDPYIVPYYIGGSMYARNPPYPKEEEFATYLERYMPVQMHQQLDYGREKFD